MNVLGQIVRQCSVLAICAVFAFGSPAAKADVYVVTVQSQTGASYLGVRPGNMFRLYLNLDSIGYPKPFNIFYIQVSFSEYGLWFDSYDFPPWEFVAGGVNDFSVPHLSSLPAYLWAIADFEAATQGYPGGATAGPGTLVTMDMMVHPRSLIVGPVSVQAIPGFIDYNFIAYEVQAGPPFTLILCSTGVNQHDYRRFCHCLSGPRAAVQMPGCACADFDGDHDADLSDVALFQQSFTECADWENICDDGEDNDCDGATDCDDADCEHDPSCW